MEIRQLKYFITLVEEKSYTRAAQKLHLTQPSLSTSMKKLENELNLILIDKEYRKFKLTDEGDILYYEAKKLLNHHEHISHEMRRLKDVGPPILSIGLIESSVFFIPNILKKLKEKQPNMKISLYEKLSHDDVKLSLKNYEIDLAITNQFIQNESIKSLPIYKENLIVMVPKGHELEQKRKLSIYDLEGKDFIVCKEGLQTRNDIVDAFHKAGVFLNISFEIDRFETACKLVENGLGITIIPGNYIRNSKKFPDVSLLHLHNPEIKRTVYLAYDKNRYFPPIIKWFITTLKEFFVKY